MGWFSLIFIVVFEVIFFICCIVALIRGVELGLMKILLPIMACDLTSIRQEKWNNFIVVAFGYIIQMVLYKFALTYAVQSDMLSLLKSIVCLFFFIKTPNWLQKFAYSSGLKDTARSGMYMGMMLGRSL